MSSPRSSATETHIPFLWSGLGLAVLAPLATNTAPLAGVATRAAFATRTTTSAGDAVTATGSEYGWGSFLFFLLVIGGGLWLWNRRGR